MGPALLLFGALIIGAPTFTGDAAGDEAGDEAAPRRDLDAACRAWANDGECDVNPGFMLERCARSCDACQEPQPAADVRASQPAESTAKPTLLQRLLGRGPRCSDELGRSVCQARRAAGECHGFVRLAECMLTCGVCHYTSSIRDGLNCTDSHESCASWARRGECVANPGFMLASCPTACASCEDKAAACDRAPNSLAPLIPSAGTINETFVRLMTSFPQYSPRALSRPGGAAGEHAPWVVTLRDFVSDDEASAFIEGCAEHFERSLAGDQLSPVRTSKGCWCSENECHRDERTRAVAERISDIVRAPVVNFEPFQVVKYEKGQFYRQHHDQNTGHFAPQGSRIYTFFMYLSTPEAGGGTKFNSLDIVVPAVKGTAVLWPSVYDPDPSRDEPGTNHEALPVEKGIKYGANAWVHNHDYVTPSKRNCVFTHKNTH